MTTSSINKKIIRAGIIGNVMEWYDFAIYGYFALIIGKLIFPSSSASTSVIAAFGAFAAGFLMRPIGSLIFGNIGDKLGRKRALLISVLMMAIPTFLIGVLPVHEQIGITAPILLVILRMLQGLSVGGEYTTSVVFLVENSPDGRRGFMASWSGWGAVAGILLGSAVASLITTLLTPVQLASWGWRLPFLIGIIIAFVGFYIRRHLPDISPVSNQEKPTSPIREAFTHEWRSVPC
jgi:MHS family proline/betaine transporter-like MFS transporter